MGGSPGGIFFLENFGAHPQNGGGSKFSDFEWLTPIMGGSLGGFFLVLRGSPGGVFEVDPPHLKEADRNPYVRDPLTTGGGRH